MRRKWRPFFNEARRISTASFHYTIAHGLDAMGFRKPLAVVGSLVRRNQSFTVDAEGHWVNRQPEATFVSPSLHVKKYSEVLTQAHRYTWAYLPKLGDTVIDVGAGIGEETLVYSKLVGATGRIISIEAHPETYACLEQTVLRSRLENVTSVLCAIADRDGELSISNDVNHIGNTVLSGGQVKIPGRSLDSLADELGLGEVMFLKMNIEGAEKLAVQGMATLSQRLKNLCVCCHDFVADRGLGEHFRSKQQVRDTLEKLGYRVRAWGDAPTTWDLDNLYADC